MKEINYKVEGNILYPDKEMLTWGPYYYHSIDKAKERMPNILDDIVAWVNSKDPTLYIKPENVINMSSLITFHIKAWKDDNTLQNCSGIVDIEIFEFED